MSQLIQITRPEDLKKLKGWNILDIISTPTQGVVLILKNLVDPEVVHVQIKPFVEPAMNGNMLVFNIGLIFQSVFEVGEVK